MTIKEFKTAYPNGTFELEFTPDALSLKISQGRVGFNLKLFELIVREPGKALTDSVKEAEERLLAKAFDALGEAETSDPSASAEKPERKMRTRKSIPVAHKSAEAPSWTRAEQLMFGFDNDAPADGNECPEPDNSETIEASVEIPAEAVLDEPVEVVDEEEPAAVPEAEPEVSVEAPAEEKPAESKEQPVEAAAPAEAPVRSSDLAAFAKLSEEEKVDAAARYVLTFGRYKGQTLGEVMGNDIGFAKWLAFKCDRTEVKVYARTLLMAAQKQSA